MGGTSSDGGTKATGGTAPITGGASATNGGTAAAGGGTSSGFRPCPTTGDACIILPLGDSITYGLQSSDGGGYREPLFKKTLTANQKITFTGSQKNGPATVQGPNGSVTFPTANEGNSGFTIDQIRGTIPAGVKAAIPQIVLLMAGTNDVYASSGQAQMPDRLTTLINAVATAAPNALIVVATLTPLSNSSWEATATTYNGKIPGVIQTVVSAGKHVIMVDMSKMPTSELSDGIHPNDTGYSYMADIWYAAIKDLLPSG
jgi:lysophospholipase L1-like esterase